VRANNPNRAERRREKRDPVNAPLGILCTDSDGRETRLQARLADISLRGAKMTVPQRLPVRTTVYFYCQKYGIGGRGSVRYCLQSGQGYEIGVEFPSGTGWKGLQGADLLTLAAKVKGSDTGAVDAEAAVEGDRKAPAS
jgi:PilZ domain